MKGVGDVVHAVGGDKRRFAPRERAAIFLLDARKMLLVLQRRRSFFLDVGGQRRRRKATHRIAAIQTEKKEGGRDGKVKTQLERNRK